MISLRQMQGAVRGTPCFSAISAAGPVLASSSAMTCTFFSMGTGSRSGFGPLCLRWPGASSSIQPRSVSLRFWSSENLGSRTILPTGTSPVSPHSLHQLFSVCLSG